MPHAWNCFSLRWVTSREVTWREVVSYREICNVKYKVVFCEVDYVEWVTLSCIAWSHMTWTHVTWLEVTLREVAICNVICAIRCVKLRSVKAHALKSRYIVAWRDIALRVFSSRYVTSCDFVFEGPCVVFHEIVTAYICSVKSCLVWSCSSHAARCHAESVFRKLFHKSGLCDVMLNLIPVVTVVCNRNSNSSIHTQKKKNQLLSPHK